MTATPPGPEPSSPPGAGEAGGSGRPPSPDEIPLGQRLFDRPFLLLVLGILVMFVFFTGWGMLEILSLTEAPLP